MGYALKTRDGSYITRPISHPATDEQVKAQLAALLEEGGIEVSGSSSARDNLINAIDIEYGRINGEASYYFLRIPRCDLAGNRVTPKVALTSTDGNPMSAKCSALTFAQREKTAVCINAGLFNTGKYVSSRARWPEGALVINGVDKTIYKVLETDTADLSGKYTTTVTEDDGDYGGTFYEQTDSDGNIVTHYPWMVSDMGTAIGDSECYPLLIDANGDLQTL